jgi:hypothetical protein
MALAQSELARDYKLGPATIERWYHRFSSVKINEYKNRPVPRVSGIEWRRGWDSNPRYPCG